jgi:thioredoxin-like negative regulator of GroEL
MSFEVQAAALGLTGAAVGLTAVAARLTAWHARRRAVGETGTSKAGEHSSTSAAYILYFTTEQCSTCRLLQEPALEKITARVQKVDAIAERELAERFAIFTVPSTVVMGPNGTAANVNYGYADAAKLRRQLTAAG